MASEWSGTTACASGAGTAGAPVTTDQILKLLDELGKRIGPTGDYVWRLAVRQAFIDGWLLALAALVCALLLAGVVATTFAYQRRAWRNFRARMAGPNHYGYDSGPGPEPFLIGGFLAVFLVVGLLGCSFSALTILLNPEYHAMLQILQGLHP